MLHRNNWGCVLSALSRKVFNRHSFKADQDAHQGSKMMCAKNWAEIFSSLAVYAPHTYRHTYIHTYIQTYIHTDRSPASSPFHFLDFFIRTLTSGKPQCGNKCAAALRRGPTQCFSFHHNLDLHLWGHKQVRTMLKMKIFIPLVRPYLPPLADNPWWALQLRGKLGNTNS